MRPLVLYLTILICVLTPPSLADKEGRQLVGKWDVTFAKNGQANLRVFFAGEGPTIVMLPGQGSGPPAMEPLAERLIAAGFRIVLPEPRGYGESVGPLEGVTLRDLGTDLARAIESIGTAPVVVVGHAFGNRIARMLASDRPDLVKAVALLAAGGKYPARPEALANLRIYLDKSLPAERRIEAGKAALFGPKSNPGPDDIALDGASADTIKAQISASDPKVFPLEAWWPGGKAPMLVIQGLEDVVAPPENGRSLKADYPDRVTLVEFPDLGHAMLRERPDLTAETIATFVRKLGR